AGQGRVCVAVRLRLVVRLDGPGRLGSGQGAVDEGDVVVGEVGAGAGCDVGGDRVVGDAARGIRAGGVAVDEMVAVLDPGDGAGEDRVGVAVHLGLVGGRDGQGCLGDGEGAVDELDIVVGEVGAGAGCEVCGDGVVGD